MPLYPSIALSASFSFYSSIFEILFKLIPLMQDINYLEYQRSLPVDAP